VRRKRQLNVNNNTKTYHVVGCSDAMTIEQDLRQSDISQTLTITNPNEFGFIRVESHSRFDAMHESSSSMQLDSRTASVAHV